MFVFFFFELRTCAAPVSKSKCLFLVQMLPPAAARPPAPSPLGPPLPRVALRVRGAGTGSGGAFRGSGKEGGAAARGGREVALGSGTARARAQDVGRWRAVSRVSYASRPPPWPLVAPRSLVLTACGVQRA